MSKRNIKLVEKFRVCVCILLVSVEKGDTCTNIEKCKDCTVKLWVGEDCWVEFTRSSTEGACKANLDTIPDKAVVFKESDDNKCFRSDCDPFIIYSDKKLDVIYHKTCNTDCLEYELQQFEDEMVQSETPTDAVYSNIPTVDECLQYCLQTTSSCTLSFNGIAKTCLIYTACAPNCVRTSNNQATTIRRRCSGSCPVPDPIANGEVSYNGTLEGDTVVYTCHTGYELTNGTLADTASCTSSGNWDTPPPECKPLNCSDPTIPNNGNSNNGIPVCNIVNCSIPTSIENGNFSLQNGYSYGANVTYSCDTGYNMTGTDISTCGTDGSWSQPAPLCYVVNCNTSISPAGGNVSFPNGTTVGQLAMFNCDLGYYMLGSDMAYCGLDGNWNASTPMCTTVDCNVPAFPDNGIADYSNGTTYGEIAIYICDKGYSSSGNNFTICLDNGNWNNAIPVCNIVNCSIPTSIKHGNLSLSNGNSYGANVTYTCDTGYNMTGPDVSMCGTDGSWSLPEPSCQPVDCGSLAGLPNGHVNISGGTVYGQVARYSCDTGYNISFTYRDCLETGEWSLPTPVCTIYECRSLTAPLNGSVDMPNASTYGEVANYSCDAGFYLSGDEIRVCEDGGTWNSTEPLCIIDCGTITLFPTDGSIDFPNGTHYGSVAVYSCNTNSGQEMENTGLRECLENGSWSVPVPSCVLKDCGYPQDPPENGSMSLIEGTLVHARVYFACLYGLVPYPRDNRHCKRTGQWEPTENITCVVPPPTNTTTSGPKPIYIMPCYCNYNSTLAGLTQDEIIAKLIADTAINKSNTTLAISKLKCRSDPRISSMVMGTFASTVIASIFGITMLSDCSPPEINSKLL